jgi:hypothetical protein
MKGQKIKRIIIFECFYELSDCVYKNPLNKGCCVGCKYAKLVEQTPPVFI